MNKKNSLSIIGLTTDPYDCLHGYTVAFVRLFKYLEEIHPELHVVLISNEGTCSHIIKTNNTKYVSLNEKNSLLLKTISLFFSFIRLAKTFDSDTIIVANCEIPELLAAWVLKIKFKNVYCIIQDTRIRDTSLKTKVICYSRVFLLKRINSLLCTNRFTMKEFTSLSRVHYIGNIIT